MPTYQAKVADGSHDTEKAKRIANQVNAIQNPLPPPVYTKLQLQTQKADYLAQTAAQIAQFDTLIGKAT